MNGNFALNKKNGTMHCVQNFSSCVILTSLNYQANIITY
jgi:hypothetical protein